MRHRSLLVLAVSTAGVLAACSDAAPPAPTSLPTALARRSAVACDPGLIRSSLASLLRTGEAKSQAIPGFNEGEKRKRRGDLPAARQSYHGVINVVLEEYAADRLREPKNRGSMQSAVVDLVTSLYACGSETPPDGLFDAIGELGNAGPDEAICVASGGESLDCTLPNEDVTVQTDAAFLKAPAFIRIRPGGHPIPGFPDAWSPLWDVSVTPLDAQVNYPQYGSGPHPTPAAFAAVAVCVADRNGVPHPPLGTLRVAQGPDVGGGFLLPAVLIFQGTDMVGRLDCTEGSTDVAALHTSPFGASSFAVAGWRAVLTARDAIGDALSPRNLYAFDGGLGGVSTSFESTIAVVNPADLTSPLQLAYICSALNPNPTGGNYLHVYRIRNSRTVPVTGVTFDVIGKPTVSALPTLPARPANAAYGDSYFNSREFGSVRLRENGNLVDTQPNSLSSSCPSPLPPLLTATPIGQ